MANLVYVIGGVIGILCLLGCVVESKEAPRGSKLMIIMVDGFRWDYFDKFEAGELIGFENVEKSGVKAQHLQSQFPANSYINYYSLMTGLYPESHGMVDNYMYDPVHKTEFLIGTNPEQYEPYWWEDGDPLWITATRQGKRVYLWYWCGCEVEIRGLRPAFCASYQNHSRPGLDAFKVAVDESMEVLKNGSADIVAIYYELVDHYGHHGGPDSQELKNAVRDFDKGLQYLQGKTKVAKVANKQGQEVPLEDDMNLIIFSDHGMNENGCKNRSHCVIQMEQYINVADLEVWNTPSQYWPKPGKLDQVYDSLKSAHPQLTVWKREEIPEYLHWKNHRRVPPIVVTRNLGYQMTKNSLDTVDGNHGYSPNSFDMLGIFYAQGPAFKKNFKKVGFENIQLYQLMCHLQGLEPSPNNGTWSFVEDMLEVDSGSGISAAGTLGLGLISTLLLPLVLKLI